MADHDDHNPLAGVFSPIESQMGQDAYQSNVLHTKAQAEVCKSIAHWHHTKAATLGSVVPAILFLTMLPVWVWLWRWAI